jgi:S1-C subfamily serine protease
VGANLLSVSSGKSRPITARGDLAEDEKATIALFEQSSKSVVFVSPISVTRSYYGDEAMVTGTGTGFAWDQQGHIVTNVHVIENANACRVTLYDNSTYDAEFVGASPDHDIAVLRIDAPASKLIPIPIGTSHDLRVGQKVFAIGNPFGLDYTLTTGVVSALNREIQSRTRRSISGVIQIDAAINPGNSGGPLLDSAGRLIGMNTAIYSPSGASAGVGFAIPVDTINRIVPQLIANGQVTRPGMGITLLSDAFSERARLPGVAIEKVLSGSAADRAGLQGIQIRNGAPYLGDVIVQIGETPTPDSNALFNALEQYEVGETVNVVVRRGNERVRVPVKLQKM